MLVPLVGEIKKYRRKENVSYHFLGSYVPIASSVGQIVTHALQMKTISILMTNMNVQIF